MKISRRHFFLSFLAVPFVGMLGFIGKKYTIAMYANRSEINTGRQIGWYYIDSNRWVFSKDFKEATSVWYDLHGITEAMKSPDHSCWQDIPREYLPFYDIRCVPDERFEELINGV